MRLSAAIRLKPGAKVLAADNRLTHLATQWWMGEVRQVTENGGVLVLVTEGKQVPNHDWSGPGTGPDVGTEKWFPYNRVWKRV